MRKSKCRKWLAEFRGDLTHQEVADRAGIDRSTYTMIESGLRSTSVETAKKIAAVLGFDWTLFFEDIGGESQPTGTAG